jgi:outer membrane protein TolC
MRFVKGGLPQYVLVWAGLVLLGGALPAAAQGQPTTMLAPPSPQPQQGPPPPTASALAGSVPSPLQPGTLKLTMKESVERALQHNLAIVLGQQNVESARGSSLQALSGVLPEIGASMLERRQTTNLETFGITIPGFPALIGPFNVFDARVSLSQSVFDLGAIERNIAGNRNVDAVRYSLHDARDLVVVAAADLYFQVIAARARVLAAQAQVETADALARQASDMKQSGLVAGIDLLRAQVQTDTERHRLVTARNDEQRQRLMFARAIGLAPRQSFELVDEISYRPMEPVPLETAVRQAYEGRSDLKAAESRLKALEAEHRASMGERLPSVHLLADYGTTGLTIDSSLPTFTVMGVVRVPIFNVAAQRAHGVQTQAAVQRQSALVADLRAGIAYEVELALADVAAADERVKISKEATDLATQQLEQARDRFAAGVGDNIAIVQAQQALAASTDAYIQSLFSHNVAKAAFARALGNAEESGAQLFGFSR